MSLTKIEYPFLFDIINLNHSYIQEFRQEEDFDSYIILMNLYLYTCKFMKKNNIELNKLSIYNNMKLLFSNYEIRNELIDVFTRPIKKLKTIKLD